LFESNGTVAFQNELGVFVEAFVEQHLHSILTPIVKGDNTGRSHLQWNEWLDQMSGFGIGNQSSDALMIAVFWQWKNEGFHTRNVGTAEVPELRRLDTPECKAFYDFDRWVRDRREAEKLACNRPHAEHELFRRLTGDDQSLTATRTAAKFYKLQGYLQQEPDKKVYKSEGFCVMLPDDRKKGHKTHRFKKVLHVHRFRGRLLFRAAQDLQLLEQCKSQSAIEKIQGAFTFLVLRPSDRTRPSGLRDSDYCTTVIQETHRPTIDLQIHPKQKRAAQLPVSIYRAQLQLPSSRIAAARLHHPQFNSSRIWNRLASRLQKASQRECVNKAVAQLARQSTIDTLQMVTLPDTQPLADAVIETHSFMHMETTKYTDSCENGKITKDKCNAKPSRKKNIRSDKAARRASVQTMLDEEMEFVTELHSTPYAPIESQSTAVLTTVAAAPVVIEPESITEAPAPARKRICDEPLGGTDYGNAKRHKQTDGYEDDDEDDDRGMHLRLYQLRAEWRSHKIEAASSVFRDNENEVARLSSDDEEDDCDGTDDENCWQVFKAAQRADEALPNNLKCILRQTRE
jgi:hypothetical protein